jgi:trk system potassium uptake protein TrkA
MYVIIVGGGKVGYYLTKTLVNEGYEVLLIERNAQKVATFTERFGAVVLAGDGAEVATLDKAGAARADVVVAVTGEDEDNLVICQVAKKRFNVPKTIARVNNPKNEQIFRLLGIDVTVSQTNIILNIIEQEIPDRPLVHLMTLKHAQMAIVETIVGTRSAAVNQPLSAIKLPDNVVLSAILRDGELLIPRGDTRLLPGDEVIAVTDRESEDTLRRLLTGE